MLKNRCMAHRGWSALAPENTLAAIRKAVEHPNIEMIEIDVQMSRDGVPVVIHDYTLERTTNGFGTIGEKTLPELKKLDAGSWFDSAYTGETIPTLEEVLQEACGKVMVNIEMKRAGNWYPGIERKVIELIRQYDMASHVMITSFNHATIQEISRLTSDMKTGLLIYGVPVLVDELLKWTGATVLSMCYPYLTENFIRPLLTRGIELIAWTIDDPKHMQQVAKLDERIVICTNYPDRWFASSVL